MKSYTDLEQSKKLAEMLPLESADMYWWYNGQRYYIETKEHNDFQKSDIPAWSLAALLDILPNYQLQTQDDGVGILCSCNGKFNIVTADNPVDACVELIVKLKEQNLI